MHRPVHFILCSCRTVPPAALLPARESRNFLVLIWFGFWLVTPVFMAGWWEGWEPAKQLCPVWCFREFRLTFCRSCQEFQRLYNHKSAYSLGLPSNKGQSTEPFRSLIRLTCQWAVLSGRIKGSHQSNVSKALFVLSSSAGWWIFKLFQQLTHSTNARSVRQCLGFASVTCSDPSVTGWCEIQTCLFQWQAGALHPLAVGIPRSLKSMHEWVFAWCCSVIFTFPCTPSFTLHFPISLLLEGINPHVAHKMGWIWFSFV